MSIRTAAGSAQAVVANDGRAWYLRGTKFSIMWWDRIPIAAGITRAFQHATSAGTSRFIVGRGGGGGGGIYLGILWSTAADFNVTSGLADDGEWHCTHVVYDASSTANVPTVYFDGVPQSVTVANAPTGSLPTPAVTDVGTYGNRHSLASALGGNLAHVAMWGNYLLSFDEVLATYLKGPLALNKKPTLYRPFDPVQPGGILRALGTADGAHLNPKGAHLYPFVEADDPYRGRYVGSPRNRRRIAYSAGAQTFVIGVATASATASDATATAGALAVAVGLATASATAHDAAATAGALSIPAGVAVATANGLDVVVTFAGAVIVGVGTATAVGQNVTASAGALSVTAAVAVATAAAQNAAATAGGLSVSVGVAVATALGQNAAAAAGGLTLSVGVATASALAFAPSAVLGIVVVSPSAAVATAAAQNAVASASGVSVSLGVAVANAYAQVPLVIYGSTTATIVSVMDVMDRSPTVVVFDRSPTVVLLNRSPSVSVQSRVPSVNVKEVT